MGRRLAKQLAPSSASVNPLTTIPDEAPRFPHTEWLMEYLRLDVPRSTFERYGTALAAFSIAALARLLLDPYMENRTPYGFFLIATAFVAWRCGLVPAVLTVCAGAALGRFHFESPRGPFAADVSASNASLVVSLSIGLITAFLCESLRNSAIYYARLYQLARQSDARKDEFLATLAHELRNPLTPIHNSLYLLDKLEPKDPQIAPLRDAIACQVEHLIRLVNDLLDVSRITQGKVELQIERIELKVIVDTALEVVRPLLLEKEHELQITYPPERLFLNADKVRLTQIVTNLLNNAAKYTDKGGKIWLTVETEEDDVIIRVSDTGIGIAPEMRDRIFDLFQQASHTIVQSQGGLGIGLTLVRRLVEMHGGTVEAESPGLGLGSKFTVRLPLVDRQPAPVSVPPAETRSSSDPSAPLRILVVDDLPAIATNLASLLKYWKHEVEIARDGFTGLEIARSFKPDVILADLGLPRMSGYQFAQEVRRVPQLNDVVLFAVSGYGQESDRQRSQAAGFAGHFVKPIDLKELERVLADLGAARK